MCDTDINECASSPCLNGGTCVDLLNKYSCICDSKSFKGVRCEQQINKCAESPGLTQCGSNGVCTGGIGTAPIVCLCDAGYTGLACETKIPKCQPGACQNNAACKEDSSVPSGYTCSCSSSFTGQFCETSKKENILFCRLNVSFFLLY